MSSSGKSDILTPAERSNILDRRYSQMHQAPTAATSSTSSPTNTPVKVRDASRSPNSRRELQSRVLKRNKQPLTMRDWSDQYLMPPETPKSVPRKPKLKLTDMLENEEDEQQQQQQQIRLPTDEERRRQRWLQQEEQNRLLEEQERETYRRNAIAKAEADAPRYNPFDLTDDEETEKMPDSPEQTQEERKPWEIPYPTQDLPDEEW